MKVGVDTFTIRDLNLTPLKTLDFLKEHGFDGAQFGGLDGLSRTLDLGELKEIRAHADRLGLYSHVSLSTCNPYLVTGSLEAHTASLRTQIERAAACGWHELHSFLGGCNERYTHAVAWTRHLADSAALLRSLAPVLRQHKSRVDLETHGDTTTFELVRLIEDVGPDIVGICLDTANVLCHAEDPVRAAKRAAPYTHLTHTKDAIIFLREKGYRRQTLPIGRGCLDWEKILPILAEYAPDLPLSIEDHKWLFDFDVFDPHWLRLNPDVTVEEYAAVMRLAWRSGDRIRSGELADPDAYEKIPFLDEWKTRLDTGRDYLKGLLKKKGLG